MFRQKNLSILLDTDVKKMVLKVDGNNLTVGIYCIDIHIWVVYNLF